MGQSHNVKVRHEFHRGTRYCGRVYRKHSIMNFNEYQELAGRTDTQNGNMIYHFIGVANESGEALGKVKKIIRGDANTKDQFGNLTSIVREALADELGDVLWYISRAAASLGFTLEEVADRNIKKLEDRAARGVIKGSGDNR